uniref:Uncharacterized protein n=1 Tax=Physcomitrium patens TaxID=3218 RepID=A0A2K1KZN1_PHYPA|nr:hypothetical protein PHYPA_002025 [Physcomitrium patens]
MPSLRFLLQNGYAALNPSILAQCSTTVASLSVSMSSFRIYISSFSLSPALHGHHMPQGASPGASHIAAQQGASPSLLTTPRGAPYHDVRNLNPAWNLQR